MYIANEGVLVATPSKTVLIGEPESFLPVAGTVEQIDLALVHFWFPLQPNGKQILQTILKPVHIGLVHIPIRMNYQIAGQLAPVQHEYGDIFPLITPGERGEFTAPGVVR